MKGRSDLCSRTVCEQRRCFDINERYFPNLKTTEGDPTDPRSGNINLSPLKVLFLITVLLYTCLAQSEDAETLTRELQVPGSAYVVFTDSAVLHERYYGSADELSKTRISEETLFYWHSLSKPILATAFVKMVMAGVIDPDQKIVQHIPELEAQCRTDNKPRCLITFRHLLTHTSGLDYPPSLAGKRGNSDNYTDGFYYSPISNEDIMYPFKNYTPLDHFLHAKLNHFPGEGFTYGISYDLLGELLQRITAQSLQALLEKYLFDPLGMKNTFLVVPQSERSKLVKLYDRKYATYPIPGKYKRYQEYDPDRILISRPDYPVSGGGGLIGTVRDYVIFLQAVMTGFDGDLGTTLKEYLTCPQLPESLGTSPLAKAFFDASKWSYSFGFGVLPEYKGKQCSSAIFWAGYSNNQFVVDLEESRGEIFLTNLFPLDHNISIALDSVR